jgi:hypothetical protein
VKEIELTPSILNKIGIVLFLFETMKKIKEWYIKIFNRKMNKDRMCIVIHTLNFIAVFLNDH